MPNDKEDQLHQRFGYFLTTILSVAELPADVQLEYASKLEAEGYTSLKHVMKLDEEKLKQCGIRTAHCSAIVEAVSTFRDFGYATFVSHNKENAGSEAAMIGDFFRVKYGPDRRAFVDTDDLKKLSDLVLAVEMSESVVIILSEKYIKSPFCLIEAVKSVEMKKKIATVVIQRPSMDRFDFAGISRGLDDDLFVKGLIGNKGWEILKEHLCDPHDVRKALKHLLDIKANEFSPHSPVAVRTAQLSEVFKSLGFEPSSRSTHVATTKTTRLTVIEQKVFVNDLESAVKALNSPTIDANTINAACEFLYEATGGDDFDEDDKWKRTRVVSAGADKACVSTLKTLVKSTMIPTQAKRDFKVEAISNVLKLSRNLARDYEHGIELFKLGLGDGVIDAMLKFNSTVHDIALWGCRVLVNLALSDEIRSSLLKIGASGACLDAVKHHFDDSDEISEAVCGAFRAFAVAEGDKRQMILGGVPSVLTQICHVKGKGNVRIAEKSCAAIRNISSLRENQKVFLSLGAEKAVYECLVSFLESNIQVCDKACGALANLANHEESLSKMVGYTGTILKALKIHGLEHDDKSSSALAEEALGALQNLCVDQSNREVLLQTEGGIETIVDAMWANSTVDWRVSERGSSLIRNLALGEAVSIRLCKLGILPVLLQSLRIHVNIPSVIEQVMSAIWGLSNSAENDALMLSSGTHLAVLTALNDWIPNIRVCKKACGALRNLSATPKGADVLMNNAANQTLMEILRAHASKDARLAEEACACLKNLTVLTSSAHRVVPSNLKVKKKGLKE